MLKNEWITLHTFKPTRQSEMHLIHADFFQLKRQIDDKRDWGRNLLLINTAPDLLAMVLNFIHSLFPSKGVANRHHLSIDPALHTFSSFLTLSTEYIIAVNNGVGKPSGSVDASVKTVTWENEKNSDINTVNHGETWHCPWIETQHVNKFRIKEEAKCLSPHTDERVESL